jgi:hypothetical protein
LRFPISKGFPLLWLAACCTVLRSRWCQSGVNITLLQRVALILVRVARVHLLCTDPVQEAYRRRSVYRSNDYETRCIRLTLSSTSSSFECTSSKPPAMHGRSGREGHQRSVLAPGQPIADPGSQTLWATLLRGPRHLREPLRGLGSVGAVRPSAGCLTRTVIGHPRRVSPNFMLVPPAQPQRSFRSGRTPR